MKKKELSLIFNEGVSAGFPSPAEGYSDGQLDLNEYIVKHPAATFYVKADGDSMKDAGIFSGDTLVVDRSLNAVSGNVIIAVINGEFTVKNIYFSPGVVELRPANNLYSSIFPEDGDDFQIWGIVTCCIHQL